MEINAITKKKEAVNGKRPRMLDLNAPLLSARRLVRSGVSRTYSSSQGENSTISDRVPFSWEQEPGKPKVLESCCCCRMEIPSKKERHSSERTTTTATEDGFSQGDYAFSCQDDEEGINDEDAKKSGHVSLSGDDAIMDMQSLSEAIDYVERRASKIQKLDRSKLKSHQECFNDDHSFMMQRFLPDATALAESSALSNHLNNNNNKAVSCLYNYPRGCISTQSYVTKPIYSPRLCGLRSIFPNWSIKHQPCGGGDDGVKPSVQVQRPPPATPKYVKKLATLARGSFTSPIKDI